MMRLLLLFVLSPVLVFSQTLRQGVVDSIKAATVNNLHTYSALLSNHPGTKVEHVDVFDTGEYVTIITRIRVARTDTITAIATCPLVAVKTGDIAAESVGTVTLPPLPPVVAEPGIVKLLPLLPLIRIKAGDNVAESVGTVTLPPLPPLVAEEYPITALSPHALIRIKTGNIITSSVSTVAVALPPLPPVIAADDTLVALPVLPPVRIKTENIVVLSVTPVALPLLLPPVAAAEMPVAGMHLSADGYSLLEKLEGFSPELYSLKDGGFTIGFGFFVPYTEVNKWDNGVTLDEAQQIIRQKVPAYEDQVKRYINVPVTQSEFDALTMLAYNLGGFSKATSIVNDVNSDADFTKLQSDWSRFVHSKAPNVAKGLMNRRKDELGVKKYADYQPERKMQILKIRK